MKQAESKALWDKVRANSAMLESCAGPHEFVDATPERRVGKDHRCARCGGTVDSIARHWYERGLTHGRTAS